MLGVHIAELDRKALRQGGMNDYDAKQYLAWSNTQTRTLARLGPAVAVQKAQTLADRLAAKLAAQP